MSLEDPFFVVKQEVIKAIGTSRGLFERWYDLARHTSSTTVSTPTNYTHAELDWTANELRNSLRSIDWDLEDLDETISIVEKNPKKFRISEADLTDRKAFIQKTRTCVQDMRDELLNGNPHTSHSDTNLNQSNSNCISNGIVLPKEQFYHHHLPATGRAFPNLNGNLQSPGLLKSPLSSLATPSSSSGWSSAATTPILGVGTNAVSVNGVSTSGAGHTVDGGRTSEAVRSPIQPAVTSVLTVPETTVIRTIPRTNSGAKKQKLPPASVSTIGCVSMSSVSGASGGGGSRMSRGMGGGRRQDRYTRLRDQDTEVDMLEQQTNSSHTFLEDVQRQQQTLISEQDDHIEEIGSSVRVLKDISGHIGTELDEQAVMLDDFANEMDQTQSRLDNVMQKMSKVMGMSTDRRQWCAIGILTTIMVIVIILFFAL